MRASINWLKDYVNINETPEVLAEKLTMAGIPVEHIQYLGKDIENIVTGKIVEMKHHPDADKLWICLVNVGQEQLTIVTGAQNVRLGDIVPVALVGAKLPSGMKIKPAKLRGVASQGMLCSAAELNLDPKTLSADAKEGIYILPASTEIGLDIKSVLGLDDVILEFELTANRADCFSMLGIAREIAVLTGQTLKKPMLKLSEKAEDKAAALAKVTIAEPTLCSRFTARILKDVKVGPSPAWMQQRIQAAGMRPINNIVDVTNFVMLEMGQPMHAYDYNLLAKHHLIVRRAHKDEPLTTLDGIKRTLTEDMLVIADEMQAVGIAGVMGGLATEVAASTKMVMLEAASFHSASIRRTSRVLGLRSEASGRFERGVDTVNIIRALDRAAELLENMGACKVCQGILDSYSSVALPRQITFTENEINGRLGTCVPGTVMTDILRRLEFVVEKHDEKYVATVPTWRNDVTGIADISEEIARIYGYNNIPSTTPHGVMSRGTQSYIQKVCDDIKQAFVGIGFYETISFSFMHPSMFDKLNIPQNDKMRQAIEILNPITDEFPILRTTLISGVLDVVLRNLSRKNDDIKIFELGAVYLPKELPITEFPQERLMLAGALTGKENAILWNTPNVEADFYSAKGSVEVLLEKLGLHDCAFETGEYAYLHPGKTAVIRHNEKVIGMVGELHPQVQKNLGLTKKVYLFELDVEQIADSIKALPQYKPLPKYPAISRDLAVVLPMEVTSGNIVDAIVANAGSLLEDVNLFDVYQGEQVAKGYKSLAFSLNFRALDRTLTDQEVDEAFKATVTYLEKTYNATLRV